MSAAWTERMLENFIPWLRAEGYERVALSRVLMERADEHFTFSLLIELDDMAAYRHLTEELWEEYVRMNEAMFSGEVVWFMALMKEISNE